MVDAAHGYAAHRGTRDVTGRKEVLDGLAQAFKGSCEESRLI